MRPSPPTLLDTYSGNGEIETYTVFYDRDGAPKSGVIVGKTPDGQRFLAHAPREDSELIAFLTEGRREPVGSAGKVTTDAEGVNHWRL